MQLRPCCTRLVWQGGFSLATQTIFTRFACNGHTCNSDHAAHGSGFGFWVSGFGFRVSDLGSRVSDLGFRVSGFGFRVSALGGAAEVLGVGVQGCTTAKPQTLIPKTLNPDS